MPSADRGYLGRGSAWPWGFELRCLTLCLLLCTLGWAAGAGEALAAGAKQSLAEGWQVQSSVLVPENGEKVSTVGYLPRGWCKTTVPASMTIGGYLLPEVLAEYHRRFPNIELQMEIANTQRIQRALLEGSIELGLTEGPIELEELVSKVFCQDELVVIAPTGHPLLKKGSLTVRDICREPFLLREDGSGTRAVVERALLRKGLKIKPLLSLASPEAIKNSVAAGMGLAFVSRLLITLE